LDIYNPAKAKNVFFPGFLFCGCVRGLVGRRNLLQCVELILQWHRKPTKEADIMPQYFAIILQVLPHTLFASMVLQLFLCDHPASNDLHSNFLEL